MNYPEQAKAVGQSLMGSCDVMERKVTVGDNIDRRVLQLESEIERLKDVKTKLANGSILDVDVRDLSRAMNY